jgi:hypothetical protein
MKELSKEQLDLIYNIQEKGTINEQVLRIEETSKSPFIFMDPKSGLLIMKGRGIPDNTVDFFRPVFDFLDMNFVKTTSIEAHFMLIYYTSSFAKPLLDLFKKLEILYKRNINIICYWYYEEDDFEILEWGEDFQSMTRLPFVLIEIPA